MFGLDPTLTTLLIICLLAACAFEFINGFHDTANAVATVIYTNSLKPWVAVIWSGIWNAIGVFSGGMAVAMGITNLIPAEILTDSSLSHSIALIMALLLTAIFWNLSTWYYGIPCSSSHTLIGSILGVGLAYSFIATDNSVNYVNWGKAQSIGLSLLLSPVLGFSLAIGLMYLMRRLIKNKSIFKEPKTSSPPPFWIRMILLLTCTGVSWSHGSNDGQKGIGLVMIILIAIVPGYFAIDSSKNIEEYKQNITEAQTILGKVKVDELHASDSFDFAKTDKILVVLKNNVSMASSFKMVDESAKFEIRKNIIFLNKSVKKLLESNDLSLSNRDKKNLKNKVSEIASITEYAPNWVFILIAISLGLGTMIGWKRIVLTIGEKIGKQHLTYAQGASSELVAASTIGLSTYLGLPVSTTHILSSGIAGSMVASKGVKNLQPATIKSIAIAWILTLPVCIIMAGGLFLLFRWIF